MDEGGKWQLFAVVTVVALAVLLAVRFLDRAEGSDVTGSPVQIARGDGAAAGPAGGDPDRRPAGPSVVVHVAGAVRRPGVYRLADGSRVGIAVRRAGGATRRADLMAVNLAAPLADGQQVIVPARVGTTVAGGAASGEAPLNLATATAAELEELDGIGETIAERIVEYRTEHGGLRSIDELGQIDGIGEKRLEALKDELQP